MKLDNYTLQKWDLIVIPINDSFNKDTQYNVWTIFKLCSYRTDKFKLEDIEDIGKVTSTEVLLQGSNECQMSKICAKNFCVGFRIWQISNFWGADKMSTINSNYKSIIF